MTPADLRERAERLRALAASASDPLVRDELAFLAGEYDALAEGAADFPVSTMFPD